MAKNILAQLMAENKRLKDQVLYYAAKADVIQQWTGQFLDDLITIVLADSETMGKDTFGVTRIQRINAARDKLWDTYKIALEAHPESDWARETIDRRLRQIIPDMPPWAERYEGWSE